MTIAYLNFILVASRFNILDLKLFSKIDFDSSKIDSDTSLYKFLNESCFSIMHLQYFLQRFTQLI